MKVVGLVTTTRPDRLQMMLDSLSDCDDVIVFEDKDRRGVGWARNQLLDLAPPNSIVRFVDDDDIAFSTRQMAERLIEKDLDALTCSYLVRDQRVVVPDNPVAACCNRVSSWSWVAKIDAIRSLRWDESKKVITGAWQWLQYMKSNLKLGTAPDIWCYHWIPAVDGITSLHANKPHFDLYEELLSLVETKGNKQDLLHLVERIQHYDTKYFAEFPVTSRYQNLFADTKHSLHDKLAMYINTRGQFMIASKQNSLTVYHCADIVSAANRLGFQKAMVRSQSGSSISNESHRTGSVCFLKPEDLQPDTLDAIHQAVMGLNSEHYKANIDKFDLQVAEYTEGQVAFEWHNDDPPYPSNDLIWSGRKLTCVFELSNSNDYSGGYLDVDAYRSARPVNMFGQNQKEISDALSNLNAVRMDTEGNKITIYLDESPRSRSVSSVIQAEQTPTFELQSDRKREQGECTIFPSFFYHKVNPITRGKRYSLTVWAKGPVWV